MILTFRSDLATDWDVAEATSENPSEVTAEPHQRKQFVFFRRLSWPLRINGQRRRCRPNDGSPRSSLPLFPSRPSVQSLHFLVKKFGFVDNSSVRLRKFRFQVSESGNFYSFRFVRFVLFVVHNLRISEKEVIHESNAVFKGFV